MPNSDHFFITFTFEETLWIVIISSKSKQINVLNSTYKFQTFLQIHFDTWKMVKHCGNFFSGKRIILHHSCIHTNI